MRSSERRIAMEEDDIEYRARIFLDCIIWRVLTPEQKRLIKRKMETEKDHGRIWEKADTLLKTELLIDQVFHQDTRNQEQERQS